MTSPPDDTTADLHAAIAVLRAERDAALAREAKLDSDYAERAAHQGATVEVLQAMAASPGEPEPVFEVIVRRARDLCDAYSASLARVVDGSIVLRAYCVPNEAEAKGHEASFPRPVAADTMFGRAILAREPVQLPDVAADQAYALREGTLRGAVRAQAAVPLMRDGEAIGAINMTRRETGEFSQAQIELLQVFANQAVIAINSAKMYRALQTRTSDLQETLEYQTAISDVLKVISRSTFDLQPVLNTVVETAARLCDADQAVIYHRAGETARLAANFGFPPDYETYQKARGAIPIDTPGSAASATVRAFREGRIVHIPDVTAVPGYPDASITLGKQRTSLGVPLLREGEVIGTILLARERVEPFTDRQIDLVSTFADQAVIAIENARLITEQREALEQQTATAEVLQVINASPGNLTPVFDAMLEKATRLCEAASGILWTYEGARFRAVAQHGLPYDLVAITQSDSNWKPTSSLEAVAAGQDLVRDDDMSLVRGAGGVITRGGMRTGFLVALRKGEQLLGAIRIFRQEARPFTDKQIALVQNFASQAVIAMENARLLDEIRQRTIDLQQSLEYQTATSDVLKVISRSTFDLKPVLEALLSIAKHLCDADYAMVSQREANGFRALATQSASGEWAATLEGRLLLEDRSSVTGRAALAKRPVQIADAAADPDYALSGAVAVGQTRTCLGVPLLRDGVVVGVIILTRTRVEPFSDRQIELVSTFADQAVIAIENTRLLTEQREALEQQTATAEVLQVINANPGNLAPVFDTILEKAHILCSTTCGSLELIDRDRIYAVAVRGFSETFADALRNGDLAADQPATGPLLRGEQYNHIIDVSQIDHPTFRGAAKEGLGTVLFTPLRKDGVLLGMIASARREVRPFSEKEIAILESFAAQAVIAMENSRLLNEVRQRQEELRITFENMGDGVAMFDETPRLVAWNRKFQEIFDVPDALLAEQHTYADYIRYLAERGDYGPGTDVEEQVHRITGNASQHRTYERTRPDGRVIEIRNNPVAGGGFVLIFSDITERKQNEAEIRAARDAAEEASRKIEAAYRELKTAQANLIQAEKMASLGQLTAGIAHEIKNPLNFVNNFAALSVDLLGELKETAAPGFAALTEKQRAEVEEVSVMLTSNLEKITEHGRRADGIVKAMLEHSRGSSGERRVVDLNALIDEALNLAYHGARAQDQSFNITLERDFGAGIAPIEVNPQDITRVFLNIFGNGFYAATRRARNGEDAGFVPTLKVTTRDAGAAVEIRVRDNGTGIPADIRDKLFQPFFTTKPTGEGTGLGLSITYDIVTQQHGGSIAVDSEVGEYSEFTIRLPRNP